MSATHAYFSVHAETAVAAAGALTSELVAGDREKPAGGACARIARRAIGLPPQATWR